MAKYVSLINWTDQGIRDYKKTVDRARAAEDQMANLGMKVLSIYWTLGSYDIVVITEAPDEETATAFLLALGGMGNVRTTTMRAFDADEMSKIISKVG